MVNNLRRAYPFRIQSLYMKLVGKLNADFNTSLRRLILYGEIYGTTRKQEEYKFRLRAKRVCASAEWMNDSTRFVSGQY